MRTPLVYSIYVLFIIIGICDFGTVLHNFSDLLLKIGVTCAEVMHYK